MRDYDRLLHILGAIDDVIELLNGENLEAFVESDKVKRAAAERYMMIIGEAAHMVSDRLKQAHPEIDWGELTALRNMIAHEYMRVDYSALFRVVCDYLPKVRDGIAAIEAKLPRPE